MDILEAMKHVKINYGCRIVANAINQSFGMTCRVFGTSLLAGFLFVVQPLQKDGVVRAQEIKGGSQKNPGIPAQRLEFPGRPFAEGQVFSGLFPYGGAEFGETFPQAPGSMTDHQPDVPGMAGRIEHVPETFGDPVHLCQMVRLVRTEGGFQVSDESGNGCQRPDERDPFRVFHDYVSSPVFGWAG